MAIWEQLFNMEDKLIRALDACTSDKILIYEIKNENKTKIQKKNTHTIL